MAVTGYTQASLVPYVWANNVVLLTWAAVPNGNSGAPASGPGFVDRTFQATGTFGAGGTLVIEGSNDGTNYYTLNDAFGTPLSFTAAGLRQVTEVVLWIRPRVTAGDGTTALTVTGLFRNPQPN